MRLNTGRAPPQDGQSQWRYPQGSVILRAPDKPKLIEIIFQYRLRNNIAIGDIEGDIDRFYCNRWPKFCTADSSDVAPQFQEPMLNRIGRWAAGLVAQTPKGGWSYVTTTEAESRANICMNCRYNVGWRGNCGGCVSPVLQILQQIKQLRRTKRDGNLNACLIGVWENTTAAWLPVEALAVTEEQRNRMPEWCWRKSA